MSKRKQYQKAYFARLKQKAPEVLRAYRRRYYLKHKARIRARQRKYNEANQAALNETKRAWNRKNRKRSNGYKRAWAQRNPEKDRQSKQDWQRNNKKRHAQNSRNSKLRTRDRRNATYRARWESDVNFSLRVRLRCRIRSALVEQSTYKRATTEQLLGCTIEEFRAHLESQFLPDMTWDNRELWHIDHKRPCCTFDLTDPVQQRECFHYTNLQPLWGLDNLRKGSKLELANGQALR